LRSNLNLQCSIPIDLQQGQHQRKEPYRFDPGSAAHQYRLPRKSRLKAAPTSECHFRGSLGCLLNCRERPTKTLFDFGVVFKMARVAYARFLEESATKLGGPVPNSLAHGGHYQLVVNCERALLAALVLYLCRSRWYRVGNFRKVCAVDVLSYRLIDFRHNSEFAITGACGPLAEARIWGAPGRR
jgi:hypothetical protein